MANEKTMEREVKVVQNQLRIAIGIVKSKSAALQYESRIAELYAAGADVGDFGHSRKLFPEMISAACAYVDKKTTEFLSTPLPNTGMPPHFYTDCRQVHKPPRYEPSHYDLSCCRQWTPRNFTWHEATDGTGGTGSALAEAIFRDVEGHVGLKERALLQMQGKVVDGQYVNARFISAMNFGGQRNGIQDTASIKCLQSLKILMSWIDF